MSAREKRDKLIEIKIQEMLIKQPQIIQTYINTRNNMTTLTREYYLRYISDFNKYLSSKGILIEDAKPMNIEEYINSLKENCKEGIINARLATIRSFYNFLVENEIIQKSPCVRIKKLKDTKEKELVYLTIDDIENIKRYILGGYNRKNEKFIMRDYCLFLISVRTGLRASAILNIDIDDINIKKKYIVVTEKGNITKNVMFGEDTKQAILDWYDDRKDIVKYDERAFFVSNRGERMSPRNFDYIVKEWGKAIGKRISPHKLRSTCAMTLYEKTGDIYLVQQQLGHKDIRNTMIYAKATETKMRDTANLLDEI